MHHGLSSCHVPNTTVTAPRQLFEPWIWTALLRLRAPAWVLGLQQSPLTCEFELQLRTLAAKNRMQHSMKRERCVYHDTLHAIKAPRGQRKVFHLLVSTYTIPRDLEIICSFY